MASSVLTAGTTITSSPSFQSAGVATLKFAQYDELFGIQRRYSSAISLDDFNEIKEVRDIKTDLNKETWNAQYCKTRIALVQKFVSDKNWWRNFKIGGAVLTALAATGIGVYLKYFSGQNNPNQDQNN